MRFLISATIAKDAGNRVIRDGTIGQLIESITGDLKPEYVFFRVHEGQRTVNCVVNVEDASQMPATLEPFWLALSADVTIDPIMLPADLQKGMQSLEPVVKKYS